MSTFIIADDHPVTLSGIASHIKKLGHTVLGTFDNGIAAYNHIMAGNADFAILDLSMPGMNGLEVLEKVRIQNKKTKIIIYTMYTETTLFNKAVKLGVNGYILKEFALEELEVCLETLKFKKEWFSPRLNEALIFKESDKTQKEFLELTGAERKIVAMISQQKSSKEIADLLFISEKTVENHRSNIIKKLQLPKSKNALLVWAIKNKEGFKNIKDYQ